MWWLDNRYITLQSVSVKTHAEILKDALAFNESIIAGPGMAALSER
jgi:hypothetical protein